MTNSEFRRPPRLSPSEAMRRMPSLALIESDDIRAETLRLTQYAPAYFWERAGSTAGYHNAHEHGLWAHTLKLSTVIERLADSYTQRELIREDDVDRAHAAAILHDQRKEGRDGGNTRKDHDLLMGRVVREESDLGEAVARVIESHMGIWYEGPAPTSVLGEVVHVADMLASDDNVDMGVPGPVPEELLEVGYEEADF